MRAYWEPTFLSELGYSWILEEKIHQVDFASEWGVPPEAVEVFASLVSPVVWTAEVDQHDQKTQEFVEMFVVLIHQPLPAYCFAG